MKIVEFEQIVLGVFEDTIVTVVAKKFPIKTYRKTMLLP